MFNQFFRGLRAKKIPLLSQQRDISTNDNLSNQYGTSDIRRLTAQAVKQYE